jgi:hypothetical protein
MSNARINTQWLTETYAIIQTAHGQESAFRNITNNMWTGTWNGRKDHFSTKEQAVHYATTGTFPPKPATVATVNRELKRLGHEERLRRGKDYYYFAGGRANEWNESAVYVEHVWQLTVAQWVAERNRLAGEGK